MYGVVPTHVELQAFQISGEFLCHRFDDVSGGFRTRRFYKACLCLWMTFRVGARSSDAPARLVFVLGLGILLWGVSP